MPMRFVTSLFAQQKKAVSQADASGHDAKVWFMTINSKPTIDADAALKSNDQYKKMTEAQVLQVPELQSLVDSWPFLYRGRDRSGEPMRNNDVYSFVSSTVYPDDHECALSKASADVYTNEQLLIIIYRYIHALLKGAAAKKSAECVRIAFLISRMYIARGLPNISESDNPKASFKNDEYSDQWNVPRTGPIRTPRQADVNVLQIEIENAVKATLGDAAYNAICLLHNRTVARSSWSMTGHMRTYWAEYAMVIYHAIPLIAGAMYGDEKFLEEVQMGSANAALILLFSQATCGCAAYIHIQTWVMAWTMAIAHLDGPTNAYAMWFFRRQLPDATNAEIYYSIEFCRVYRGVLTCLAGIIFSSLYIRDKERQKMFNGRVWSLSRNVALQLAFAVQEMNLGAYRSTNAAHAKILLKSQDFLSTCRSNVPSYSRWSAKDADLDAAIADVVCPVVIGGIYGFNAALSQEGKKQLKLTDDGTTVTAAMAENLVKDQLKNLRLTGTKVDTQVQLLTSSGSFLEGIFENILVLQDPDKRVIVAGVGEASIKGQLDLLRTVIYTLQASKEGNDVGSWWNINPTKRDALFGDAVIKQFDGTSALTGSGFYAYKNSFASSQIFSVLHLPSAENMETAITAGFAFSGKDWDYIALLNDDLNLPSHDLETVAKVLPKNIPQIRRDSAERIIKNLDAIIQDPQGFNEERYITVHNAIITAALAIVGIYHKAGDWSVQQWFHQFKHDVGIGTGGGIQNELNVIAKVLEVLQAVDAYKHKRPHNPYYKDLALNLVSKLVVIFPHCSGLATLQQAMINGNWVQSRSFEVKFVNEINELNRRTTTNFEHSFDMDLNVHLLSKLKRIPTQPVDLIRPLMRRRNRLILVEIFEYTGFFDIIHSDKGNTAEYKRGMLQKLLDANPDVLTASILRIMRTHSYHYGLFTHGSSEEECIQKELRQRDFMLELYDFLNKCIAIKIATVKGLITLFQGLLPRFSERSTFDYYKDYDKYHNGEELSIDEYYNARQPILKLYVTTAIDFLQKKQPE